MIDLIGMIIGFLLTLSVFSYVFFGDNPIFRVTVYLFVGVTAGFAGAVAVRNVIFPNLIQPLARAIFDGTLPQDVFAIVPLVLSALLLLKLSPRLGRAGNVAMAYLVGVGAAIAVGGAMLGTLLPQTTAATDLFDLSTIPSGDNFIVAIFSRGVAIVGVLATLIYFHFSAKEIPNAEPQRENWIDQIGYVGQVFVAITFGVMFAGVYAAAITALIERMYSLLAFVFSFF
jgi:hypothetical protein